VDFSLPRESIETVGGHLSDDQAELLTTYGRAILRASRDVNLVSRKSLGSLGEHFVDSAALVAFADLGRGSLGDFGSGAGFPGVVVAIMRPQVDVTLVDSRRSKVVFLKDMKRRLGLDNVTVVHGRLEELRGRVEFDVGTARALGSPGNRGAGGRRDRTHGDGRATRTRPHDDVRRVSRETVDGQLVPPPFRSFT